MYFNHCGWRRFKTFVSQASLLFIANMHGKVLKKLGKEDYIYVLLNGECKQKDYKCLEKGSRFQSLNNGGDFIKIP